MRAAGLEQLLLNTGTAISLAALQVDRGDLDKQQRILLGSQAGLGLTVGPVVIAAGRNFKSFTQGANRMLGFHRVDPFKPLVGVSERIPKVFFKISRCWRRYSISRRKLVFSTSNCSALRFGPPPPSPPGGGGPKHSFQALSLWDLIPNPAATSVAACFSRHRQPTVSPSHRFCH